MTLNWLCRSSSRGNGMEVLVDLGDKKLKELQTKYDPHKADTCIQEAKDMK